MLNVPLTEVTMSTPICPGVHPGLMAAELTDTQKEEVWSLFRSGMFSEDVTRHLLGDRTFETLMKETPAPPDLFWGDANQFFA